MSWACLPMTPIPFLLIGWQAIFSKGMRVTPFEYVFKMKLDSCNNSLQPLYSSLAGLFCLISWPECFRDDPLWESVVSRSAQTHSLEKTIPYGSREALEPLEPRSNLVGRAMELVTHATNPSKLPALSNYQGYVKSHMNHCSEYGSHAVSS